MNLPEQFNSLFRAPIVTGPRIMLAMAVAMVADGLQFLLGGLGWLGMDQAIDFVAMVVISRIIGFHILFLPTFVVELVPLLEDLPTWTACTATVIALRKHDQQNQASPPKPTAPEKPVIDI